VIGERLVEKSDNPPLVLTRAASMPPMWPLSGISHRWRKGRSRAHRGVISLAAGADLAMDEQDGSWSDPVALVRIRQGSAQ